MMLQNQPFPEESLNKVLAVKAPPLPQWQTFFFPAIASTMAAPFSNPFGVARTQLQLIKGKGGFGVSGFFRLAIATDVCILQRALVPVMMRETTQNLFRIGAFQPILDAVHDPNHGQQGSSSSSPSPPAWKRMIAGGISGALGFFICNPFEIVRTKVQAQPITKPTIGSAATTLGPYRIAQIILETDGFKGFFRAGGASVALGVVCTSVNLTSYTMLHEYVLQQGYHDTAVVDMTCALLSGFLSALAMNPIDVIRTRLMAQSSGSGQHRVYRGMFDAAYKIFQKEGPAAFLKGFTPSFLRIGPHFVLTFVFLEQMRRMAKEDNVRRARDGWLMGIFSSIDEDCNGEIDQMELQNALQMADPTRDVSTAKRIVNSIFAEADQDRNGVIDVNEFLHAACTQKLDHIIREQQLVALFRSLDEDEDGFVSEKEMYDAFRRTTAFQGTDDRDLRHAVHRIMKKADIDGDGKISFVELCGAFEYMEDLRDSRLLREKARHASVAL